MIHLIFTSISKGEGNGLLWSLNLILTCFFLVPQTSTSKTQRVNTFIHDLLLVFADKDSSF